MHLAIKHADLFGIRKSSCHLAKAINIQFFSQSSIWMCSANKTRFFACSSTLGYNTGIEQSLESLYGSDYLMRK